MAKTFAQLTVNQTVFSIQIENHKFFDSTDQYGNVYSQSIFQEHLIKEISKNDKDEIRINPYRGNYGNYAPLLVFKDEDEFNSSQVTREKQIFFADKNEAHNIIRKAVRQKIKEEEESIPKHIEKVNARIELLRKKYYDSLNYLDPVE